jgi:hypothetical protein
MLGKLAAQIIAEIAIEKAGEKPFCEVAEVLGGSQICQGVDGLTRYEHVLGTIFDKGVECFRRGQGGEFGEIGAPPLLG